MATIHPTAVLDPATKLAGDVKVGPHCYVGPGVTIGPGTRLGPGCMVQGPTVIGAGNDFHGQASIGGMSQAKVGTSAGRLAIGDNNTVREHVTISRASAAGASTRIGSGNWLMACCHVGHDCTIGDDTVIANATLLGGEVQVGDGAILGGGASVHQHCRIGTLAIIGGGTVVRHDVPPFANHAVAGERCIVDINRIGLQRAGHASMVDSVKRAYRLLYGKGLGIAEATRAVQELAVTEPFLAPLAEFLDGRSKFGLVRPRWRVVKAG